MTKLLVTSDWHLSDRIWKHRPIEGDSYAACHYICDWAFENEVTHVIIAGDILDKQRNNSTAIHHLTTNLELLTDAGIKVYFNVTLIGTSKMMRLMVLSSPFLSNTVTPSLALTDDNDSSRFPRSV